MIVCAYGVGIARAAGKYYTALKEVRMTGHVPGPNLSDLDMTILEKEDKGSATPDYHCMSKLYGHQAHALSYPVILHHSLKLVLGSEVLVTRREVPHSHLVRTCETAATGGRSEVPLALDGAVVLPHGLVVLDTHPPA